MQSYLKFVQAHMDGENGRPTSLGIRQDTFKMLHTPYPPSSPNDVLYTYGAWFYLEGSADWWSRGPLLWHNGSNRFYYSQVHMALAVNEARAFFMNMGGPQSGGNMTVDAAIQAADRAMTAGKLFAVPRST
jgi:hypothetical protein